MRWLIFPCLLLAACDPDGKGTDTGNDLPVPEGADAAWYNNTRVGLGSHLSASTAPEEMLAIGSSYGQSECPDSGTGGCSLEGSEAWVVGSLSPDSYSVAGAAVAHLAAGQAHFVDDCNGDGIGELLAGMGGSEGAILVDGATFAELATFGAGTGVDSWVIAVGTGISLPQAMAIVLQKSLNDRDAGIYFFDSKRRGSLDAVDADASYRSEIAGLSTSAVGDLDGDGLDDLAVELYATSGGCEGISVAFAPFEGMRNSEDDPWCVRAVWGSGGRVLPLVDMDMDGHLDLLTQDENTVRLFRGPIAQNLEPTDARVTVRTGGADVVSMDGIGDFNGDGSQDLAIGIPWAKNGESFGAGQVYLFYAPTGNLDINDRDIVYGGIETDGELGYALTGVPDINADGRDELAVGAPRVGEGGAVYLFLGE